MWTGDLTTPRVNMANQVRTKSVIANRALLGEAAPREGRGKMKHSGGVGSSEIVVVTSYYHHSLAEHFVNTFFAFFYLCTLQITIFFTSFKFSMDTSLGFLFLQRVPPREQPFLHSFNFCSSTTVNITEKRRNGGENSRRATCRE